MDNEQIKQEITKLIELKSKITDDLKDVEKNINDMIQRLESKIKPVNVWDKYGIKEFPTNAKENFYIGIGGTVAYAPTTENCLKNYSAYPTREQSEKVSNLCYLFRKALHVMEQLNNGYEWDTSKTNFVIEYYYQEDEFKYANYDVWQFSMFYFPTSEKAEAFIDIMGKKDLKILMGIKG